MNFQVHENTVQRQRAVTLRSNVAKKINQSRKGWYGR